MRLLHVLGLFALATIGCADNGDQPAGSGGRSNSIEVKPISIRDLQAKIAAQKGRVVVVDVWATWCAPCKREFHNLVELHQERAMEGVVCISVALRSDSKDARNFLSLQNAVFANYLLSDTDSQRIQEAWGFDTIPAVFVFDRAGKRHSYWQSGYSAVKEGVNEFLAR
jgi:thiol-disulfide isomerase/thioredoxin